MSKPSNSVGSSVAELVDKARQGDMDAFATVFEGMRADVFRVASRLAGQEDAKDIVMEAFLKAWQAIPRFGGRSSIRTWMYRITYNCAIDFLRLRQRRGEEPLPESGTREGEKREVAAVTNLQPDEIVAGAELADRMTAALSLLPYEHRVTLELRYSDGLSYTEIASATGVSIGTVMSRLFNGKRKLRRVLQMEPVK